MPIQVALWESCVGPAHRSQAVSVGNGGLSSSLHVGEGWKCADGSMRHISNSSGTP